MKDQLVCVDCSAVAPEGASEYTLIAGGPGWRVERKKDEHGKVAMRWRCPECWSRFKKADAPPAGAARGPSPAAAPGPRRR